MLLMFVAIFGCKTNFASLHSNSSAMHL